MILKVQIAWTSRQAPGFPVWSLSVILGDKRIEVVKEMHRTPAIKPKIDGSNFGTAKVFALLLVMRGSVPDCCVILGKPDYRVNHVDSDTTYSCLWPVDKAHAEGLGLYTTWPRVWFCQLFWCPWCS